MDSLRLEGLTLQSIIHHFDNPIGQNRISSSRCCVQFCADMIIFHFSPDQDELFDLILAGEFEYLSPFWDDISDSAKVHNTLLFPLRCSRSLRRTDNNEKLF